MQNPQQLVAQYLFQQHVIFWGALLGMLNQQIFPIAVQIFEGYFHILCQHLHQHLPKVDCYTFEDVDLQRPCATLALARTTAIQQERST